MPGDCLQPPGCCHWKSYIGFIDETQVRIETEITVSILKIWSSIYE